MGSLAGGSSLLLCLFGALELSPTTLGLFFFGDIAKLLGVRPRQLVENFYQTFGGQTVFPSFPSSFNQ